MQTQQTHVHYAPSSVGALMDPAFLREAVLDAESAGRHEQATAGRSIRARCGAALHAASLFIRPRAGAASEEVERSGRERPSGGGRG